MIVAALNDFYEEASFLVIFHPLLPARGDMSDVLSQGSVPCQFIYGPSHHHYRSCMTALHKDVPCPDATLRRGSLIGNSRY